MGKSHRLVFRRKIIMKIEYSEPLNFRVSRKMKERLDIILVKKQKETPMGFRMSDVLREAIHEYLEARQ